MAFLSFLAGTLGVLGAAGAHYRYLSPVLGFYLALGAVAVIALNFPLNLLRFVRKGRRNISLGGMLFGLLAAAALGVVLKFTIENPVTDVTNSVSQVPPFRTPASSIPVPEGMEGFIDQSFFLARDYDPSAFEKQARAYPNIYILEVPTGHDNAMTLANAVVAKHPEWQKVHEDRAGGTIELRVEQPFFHSVDDFAIQIAPAGPSSSIFLRSRSRFGFTDFGFNAKRIRQFTDELVAVAGSMTPPMKVEFRK